MKKYLQSILPSSWLLLVYIHENGAGCDEDGWGVRGDRIWDDVQVLGALLGELENTGESAGVISVPCGVLEVLWGCEVEGLIGGWMLGSGAQGWDLGRTQLWFDDFPTTVLLQPSSPSINFLSLCIHHNGLPRGSPLNRTGRIWKRRCDMTFLLKCDLIALSYWKNYLQFTILASSQKKWIIQHFFFFFVSGLKKSHPLQMLGLFSIFRWLFLSSKQIFNWKWVIVRNEWPHFFFFKFVFFLTGWIRKQP